MAYISGANAQARLTALAEFSATDVEREIAIFKRIAEDFCGVAFESTANTSYTVTPPRTTYEIILPHQRVTAVTSVTVDGTALSSTAYTKFLRSGIIHYAGAFPALKDTVVVYTHGHTTTPEPIIEAACQYALASLRSRNSGVSREMASQQVDGGWVQFRTPNWAEGRPTGWTEPDRLLNEFRHEKMAVAFA